MQGIPVDKRLQRRTVTSVNMPAKRKERGATVANDIPRWADTSLKKLSSRTGISYKKLLSAALGMGIYQLREELAPTSNLLDSAELLAKIDPDATIETQGSAAQPVQDPATENRPGSSGSMGDAPEQSAATLSALYGQEGLEAIAARSDDVGERSTEHRESESHHDFVESLAGESVGNLSSAS